jgi:DNA-binding transcriptional ArsR family regulator
MSTIERLGPDGFSEPEPDVRYLPLDDAGPTVEALGSETAQSILSELGGDPATATEIADRVGTSVQNVCYHLPRLESAGLATVVGTRYSEKGAEMDVYARTVGAVVIGEPSSSDAGGSRDGSSGQPSV